MTLGRPRLHLRATTSTNDEARRLAAAGAPHGTLVTAAEQSAGRGRQGRSWIGRPGESLLLSLVTRHLDPLLPLRAGLAVADVAGDRAKVKWPNDVHLDGRKLAGILVEGRPQDGWAVIGIGLNVAVDTATLPPEVADIAASLNRAPQEIEATLGELLAALGRWLAAPHDEVIDRLRARDALKDRSIGHAHGTGIGAGIDDEGRLLVRAADGTVTALDAGEVHIGTAPGSATA